MITIGDRVYWHNLISGAAVRLEGRVVDGAAPRRWPRTQSTFVVELIDGTKCVVSEYRLIKVGG